MRVAVTSVNTYGTATAASAGVGPILNNAPINTAAPALTGTPQRTGLLSTTAGTWTGLGNIITYQWQRSPDGTNWTGIAGAIASSYAAQFADEGDFVRAVVTATNQSGVTSTPTASTQIIAPFPPANTAPPVITGVAERGVTLNAGLGTWTGPDNIYTYQWQRDAGEGYVNISGATAASYTLVTDDESATVRVLVTATDPDGTITQASAATAPVTDAIPVNTAVPQITGTIQRGYTITAAVGTWAGIGNSYAYQWQRSADGVSWTNISGATSPTYVVDKVDEGDRLQVMVTVTNPDGSASTPSAATVVVPSSPPAATTAPSFTGTAQRGNVLTAMQGTWTAVGNAYTYQWQRSADGTTWTNITGATALTYTPQTADEADFVRFSVTATNPDGTTTASSTPTNVVVSTPPVNTSVPTIVGTPSRSATVSATVGTWSGIGNTYTVQWQRSSDGTTWTNIAGATGFSYTIAVADEGFAVRALITAVNPDGSASQTSAATPTVSSAPPVAVNSPVITGAPLRGDTLNSTQGTWTGIGNAYSDQWQRSADGGTTWTNITGATSDSYTLTTADVGDVVRLLITAVNPDATVSAPTNVTMTVTATPPVNTAAPGISGAAQRGLTLNSAVGTWNGVGDAFAFQWQRSADSGTTWTNITGATGASYQLTPADEGDLVRIVVTGTNPDGTGSAASPPSATVGATPPVNTVPQVISGSAQRGQTLLSSAGTWLGIGNSYAYQWQHSSDGGTTWTQHRRRHHRDLPAGHDRREHPVARRHHRHQRGRHQQCHQRSHRHRPHCRTRQHHGADGQRHRTPWLHPQRHLGHLERDRQHPRLPVAALHQQRHHVVEHRRSDLQHVLAGHRRRGRDRAHPGHRLQPRRHRQRRQQPHRDRRRLGAVQQQPAHHPRHRAARQHAVLHHRRLGGHRQHLHAPVAALGRQRHHVDEHHRRHRRHLRHPGARRGRRPAARGHRRQPRRERQRRQPRLGHGDRVPAGQHRGAGGHGHPAADRDPERPPRAPGTARASPSPTSGSARPTAAPPGPTSPGRPRSPTPRPPPTRATWSAR